MAVGKWIGGFVGWMSGGPLGALAGIVVGALFDTMLDAVNTPDKASGFVASGATHHRGEEGERNSFLFSLLVLMSYIIRADGKVMHSEMEIVRRFLLQNFGAVAKEQGERILLNLFEEQKRVGVSGFRDTVSLCCQQINENMNYSQRLQLLNLLVILAQADGQIVPKEINALKETAYWIGISGAELNSMLHLKEDNLDASYQILGVSKNASDDEIRKAYRRLALQHHPDKVASLGEDVRKAAEIKFQQINDAKERIYKARGL